MTMGYMRVAFNMRKLLGVITKQMLLGAIK